MWNSIEPRGIGQRWDGEDTARLCRHLGAGIDYVEPNLPVALDRLPADVVVITHSSELGLASTGALNPGMVDTLSAQIQAVDPPWTGEHFSLVSAQATGDLGYNAAPILDDAAIEAGIVHVGELQRRYGRPLALEAGPRYLALRGWDDHAAILAISKATDCGILVDVSHHLVSMLNLGRTPTDGLSDEVLERTVELHITGLGRHKDGRHFHDHHGVPIDDAGWTLLEWVLPRVPNLKGITLEHDASVQEEDYASDLRRLMNLTESWRSQCER